MFSEKTFEVKMRFIRYRSSGFNVPVGVTWCHETLCIFAWGNLGRPHKIIV